jgi:hypothetical protein
MNGASFMAANGRGSKPSSVVTSSDSGHASTRTWTFSRSAVFEPPLFAAGPGRKAPEAAGNDPSFALDMNRRRGERLEKVPGDLGGGVLALQGYHSPMQRQISAVVVVVLHLERSRPWFHQGLNVHRKASPLASGSHGFRKMLHPVADVVVIKPRIGDRVVQRDPAVLVGLLER